MTGAGLPDDVHRLLQDRIHSVAQLETLVLLQRDPSRWWTADQVNRELRTSLQAALQCLKDLHAAELLEERRDRELAFRFEPADPALVPVVRRLAEVFADRLASIAEVIYAPRARTMREFANAFRFKRDEDESDG